MSTPICFTQVRRARTSRRAAEAQAATARSTALLAIVAGDLAASRAGPNACRQCDLAAENVSEAMHWLYQAGFAESECEEAL
jgi:hypothetical protein